ncbi:hypothetical protein CEXT_533411 [Caerostris extrusa]|uniref:Uncharacterized protein n=1 Tax=Caerostris extrusa TaxID=172846 RepID=A0AAV4RZU3_CAEEX|nr:hypothetical protein CEXT_533411 [Caerostris extrusa]
MYPFACYLVVDRISKQTSKQMFDYRSLVRDPCYHGASTSRATMVHRQAVLPWCIDKPCYHGASTSRATMVHRQAMPRQKFFFLRQNQYGTFEMGPDVLPLNSRTS